MTDVLFETGDCCVLCGDAGGYKLQVLSAAGRVNRGARFCEACEKQFGEDAVGWDRIDAEITRRKSARPQPEMYGTCPAELPSTIPAGTRSLHKPKAQVIHCVAVLLDGIYSFNRWSGDAPEVYECGGGWLPSQVDWTTVPRPPSPQVAEGWVPKVGDLVESDIGGVRFVGKVLDLGGGMVQCSAVGTRPQWQNWDKDLRPWQAKVGEWCEGTGETSGDRKRGRFVRFQSHRAILSCDDIVPGDEIATTRISLRPCAPPAEARNGESGKDKPDSVAAKDPYAEHRKRDTFGDEHKRATDGNRRFERLVALHKSSDPLDRLAAHRAQRRADFDRPSKPTYPRGNQAPCIMVRTVKRVEFIDGAHPKGWPSQGDDS